MAFKVSYFFRQDVGRRSGGWSENYWNNSADIDKAMTAALSMLDPLRGLHGVASVLRFVRVSDADNFRVVKIKEFNDLQNPNVVDNTYSDYPTTSLVLRLTGPGNYVVRQWIKGIWDDVVDKNGVYVPTAGYLTPLGVLFKELLNATNGWSLRVTNKANLSKAIQGTTQAGVVTSLGNGYATNDTVRISRAKTLTQLNGLWRITVLTPDTFQLNNWTTPAVETPLTGMPVVKKITKTYVGINSAVIEMASSHKVGRPFALLSGRARKRV